MTDRAWLGVSLMTIMQKVHIFNAHVSHVRRSLDDRQSLVNRAKLSRATHVGQPVVLDVAGRQ